MRAQRREAGEDARTDRIEPGGDVARAHELERAQRDGAADRIGGHRVAVRQEAAPVGGAERREELLARERRRERDHAVGEPLREAEQVGRDAGP